MPPDSSLNNVVNSLVRASMGTSVAPTVTDEDLDRHVADLILKEAKAKAEKYAREGIRAYIPNNGLPEGNVPRANKRFFNSLVRNVNDHNKVILQAQAESAEQIKEARRREEARDRRRRAEEAASDRMQRLMGQGRREKPTWRDDGHGWDRDHVGESSSRRHRSRSPLRRDSHRSRARARSRSPKESGGSSRRDRSPRGEHGRSRRKRRRERSASCEDHQPSKRSSRHDHSPKRSLPKRESKESEREYQNRRKEKERADSDRTDEGDTPQPLDQTLDPDYSSRSPSAGPSLPDDNTPSYSSKMDKYFSPTYDPQLDVAQPSVSKSGMLDGPQWDGWEGMLELLRTRAMDKEEKQRRAKEDKEKIKFDKKRAKQKGVSFIPTPSSALYSEPKETGLMDMQYKKRGAIKEWDLAKETPT